MATTRPRHAPVLRDQVVDLLGVRPGGLYLDATLGEGGHTARVLEESAPDGRVVGIDRDPAAIASATARLVEHGDRLRALHGRFGDLKDLVGALGPFDGILFDLGVRSPQLDEGARGFSLQHDGPVDMRMDPGDPQSASDLLDELDEDGLVTILRDYGEEPRARPIARAILAGRPWTSTLALASAVERASGYHGSRVHPATRTFQALRIAVNDELGELERGFEAALDLLRPGGRLVIISFHSLEDAFVKHRMRELAGVGTPRDAYGHPLTPPRARLLHPGGLDGRTHDPDNPRARSARVRALELLSPASPPPSAGPSSRR